ncbi:uncharacterized protein LOC136043679, partial [Artemia franciscana]|uniref:uncharacterized protein LOC136043679 n=1 Tax=Artemia franciscana TaxID=6661 RepID=UPI0032DA66AE
IIDMQNSSESKCTDSEEDNLQIASSPERRLDDEDDDVPEVHLLNQLVELLKTTFFSVIIDETTDRTIDKQLAIMVVFFSEKDLKLHVEVLDMVKCSDGSAEGLTNRIKQVIEENSIPWQNIVGFCADTSNVMFGAKRSASTLMKAMVPHILNVKCSCHLIHLCSSYACLSLPKILEDLA